MRMGLQLIQTFCYCEILLFWNFVFLKSSWIKAVGPKDTHQHIFYGGLPYRRSAGQQQDARQSSLHVVAALEAAFFVLKTDMIISVFG